MANLKRKIKTNKLMELKKSNGGVWVKASDELPELGIDYFCKIDGGNAHIMFDKPNKIWWVYDEIKAKKIHFDSDKIEWLKPVEQVYVLTEDELQKYSVGLINLMIDEVAKAQKTKTIKEFSSEKVYEKYIKI